MNQMEARQVASGANGILFMWHHLILEADREEPDEFKRCMYRQPERQAYQNAIQCLRYNGLVEDYDVENVRVKINGVWLRDIKSIQV